MQTLEQLNSAVEQLKKEVWHIARVSIPNLGKELGSLSLSDLASLTSSVKNNTSKLAKIETQLSSISQQLNSLTENFGERFEVLYDMDSSDPNINRGMTSGMVGGDSFEFTKDAYKRLRIFAVIYNNDAVSTVYLDRRKYTDLTLMSSSILLNKLYYLKVTVTVDGNKLVINQAGAYDFNTSTNTLAFTREKGSEKYYVYRVEGFY
ncbi:MAG: hypothetical protein NC218_12285 [Acetobacter sp.]|nr:hypothetical protein [Acetobacter sp.]